MEVPGRKKRDMEGASANELLCEPCFDTGQKLLAVGFCVDCNDFLCRECYKHHHKPRVYRDHVLLDENAMPKIKPEKIAMEVFNNAERCSKHKGEIIKFYCRSDRQLGCGSCMITSHRRCEELISIEEEYEKLEKDVKKFDEQLDSHSKTNEQNSVKIETNHSQAVKDIKHFLTDTKAFLETLEDKMITEADKLKDSDENKMKSISATCLTLRNDLQSLTPDLKNLHLTQQNGQLFAMMEGAKDKMKTISRDIDQIDIENKVHTYSFVPEMQIKEMVGNLKALGKLAVEDETDKDNQIDILQTSEEDNLTFNILSSGNETASKSKIQTESAIYEKKVSKSYSQVKLERASSPYNTQATISTELNILKDDVQINPTQANKTVPAKGETLNTYSSSARPYNSDSSGNTKQLPFKPRQANHELNLNFTFDEDCYYSTLTGLDLLSDNQLILINKNNQNARIVNVKQHEIITILELPSDPQDITVINNNQVAVTMPDANQIQILSISNQNISLGQTIKVKGQCHGIVHNEGSLIVTYIDPPKVEIISMSGDVIRVIGTGTNGKPLFEKPIYIALSIDKTHVYISDMFRHAVTCMTLDGEVKGIYKDQGLISPRGLTVDKTGSVYVVDVHFKEDVFNRFIYQISGDCSQGKKLQIQNQRVWDAQCIAYCHKEDKLIMGGLTNIINVFQLK